MKGEGGGGGGRGPLIYITVVKLNYFDEGSSNYIIIPRFSVLL
jgi:hypothetical protein